MSHSNALLQPLVLGSLSLRNRVVMAPMTRNFSPGNVPGDEVVEYYRRRAAGGTGLIITEGTCVGHIAVSGYPDVPYFHGEERLAGWRRVAAAVGPGFPIIFRFSQWKQQHFSARLAQTPAELEAFLAPLSAAGVDLYHCSTRRFWEPEFEGSDLNLAGWTKKLTGKPTITVGSVGLNADFIPKPGESTFREAEPASLDELLQRLQAEEFDLVAVGRALIANPDWVQLLRADALANMKAFRKEDLATLA